jgi:riboflavin synthase
MFTGIVEETGRVLDATADEGGRRLSIGTSFEDLHHGQSISVSGVCLTVEAFGTRDGEGGDGIGAETGDAPVSDAGGADDRSNRFEVFLAEETVERTYLGEIDVGDGVNLERALQADDRFDGHIVQGHVDATATLQSVERVGDDWRFGFDLPAPLAPYVVEKGSITVDGISLTVAERDESAFAVAIIPTTYDLTTLSEKAVGDPVHLEVDVVAKYVESLVEGYR